MIITNCRMNNNQQHSSICWLQILLWTLKQISYFCTHHLQQKCERAERAAGRPTASCCLCCVRGQNEKVMTGRALPIIGNMCQSPRFLVYFNLICKPLSTRAHKQRERDRWETKVEAMWPSVDLWPGCFCIFTAIYESFSDREVIFSLQFEQCFSISNTSLDKTRPECNLVSPCSEASVKTEVLACCALL